MTIGIRVCDTLIAVLVGFSEPTEFQLKTLPLVDGGTLLA